MIPLDGTGRFDQVQSEDLDKKSIVTESPIGLDEATKQSTTDVPVSLVSRWTFDSADTDGNTAIDTIGGNDGTIEGATTGAAGANQAYDTAEAYSFDGIDDRVSLGDASGLKIPQFSYAAWIRLNNDPTNKSNNQAIISKRVGRNNTGFLFSFLSSGELMNSIGNGSNETFARVAVLNNYTWKNEWNHVCAAYDPNKTPANTIYINGNQVMAKEISPPIQHSTTNAVIGDQSVNSNPLGGIIDDFQFYQTQLTPTEVQNLYNTGDIRG